MILADKIVRLRKKNGWSQEELAQKMNVSRQAVSKWESAQTVPELEKILQLGALFGVTTDYLLKDDMELEEFTSETIDSGVRQISIEEAGTYLVQSRESAKRIAVGTFLCVLSPIPLLLLGAASEYEKLNISENLAGCLGIMLLLFFVVAAVALFIYSGFQNEQYEYLDREKPFELQYGVSGMCGKDRKNIGISTFSGTSLQRVSVWQFPDSAARRRIFGTGISDNAAADRYDGACRNRRMYFCGELQHLDKHAETIKRGRLHDGSEAQKPENGSVFRSLLAYPDCNLSRLELFDEHMG